MIFLLEKKFSFDSNNVKLSLKVWFNVLSLVHSMIVLIVLLGFCFCFQFSFVVLNEPKNENDNDTVTVLWYQT